MGLFQLEGVHKQTKRKRTRTYRVSSADDAIEKASSEGLIVDTSTVVRVFPIRHFFSKIVGVTHDNEDGSSRQRALRRCHGGDQLGLLRDKLNRHSRHAVGVFTPDGKQLGFLPDEVAERVTEEIKEGATHLVFIKDIGRSQDGIHWATVIVFVAEDADTDIKELKRYAIENIGPSQVPEAVLLFLQREIERDSQPDTGHPAASSPQPRSGWLRGLYRKILGLKK